MDFWSKQAVRIITLIALSCCFEALSESETRSTFLSKLASNNLLVAFISPACQFSRHFLKTWRKLEKTKLPSVGTELETLLVNCQQETDFCVSERIRYYPALRFYSSGSAAKPRVFKGKRSLEQIKSFIAKAQLAQNSEDEQQQQHLDQEQVIRLTDENFERVTSAGFAFVKFFTDWCPHCKQLQPLFAQLPAAVKAAALPVFIAEVNCEQQQDICSKERISHYPTVWLYAAGRQAAAYEDEHSLQAWLSFLRSQIHELRDKQAVKPEIEGGLPNLFSQMSHDVELTQENFDYKVEAATLSFIKFYAPGCVHCQRLAPVWLQLAEKVGAELPSSILIGSVNCAQHTALCKQHGINAYPTLLLFKGKSPADAHRGLRDLESLSNFVKHWLRKTKLPDEL